MQFLPERAFGAGFGDGAAPSIFKRVFVGETGRDGGSLQTLTWRTPVLGECQLKIPYAKSSSRKTYVTKDWPTQHISRTKDVHLFTECSLAEPFLKLIDQMNRKPSFTFPSVARYCESGLNARLCMPKVWSERMDRGTSGRASRAVEKIKTRGL